VYVCVLKSLSKVEVFVKSHKPVLGKTFFKLKIGYIFPFRWQCCFLLKVVSWQE